MSVQRIFSLAIICGFAIFSGNLRAKVANAYASGKIEAVTEKCSVEVENSVESAEGEASGSTTDYSSLQKYVENAAKQEAFKASSLGILAVKFSGDTLLKFGNMGKLVPASNVKLITTGLALNELGADYRIATKIGYSGLIEDGVLKGDLYIIGGGDPTIGSKDSIAIETDTLFYIWKSFLDKAGIVSIQGDIIGDGRYFEGPIEESSWQYEDIGTYYGTGGNALCFYRNIQGFMAAPGDSVGRPPLVAPTYPQAPWMRFSYNCTTGEKGTGDMLYLFGNDLAPVAEMRGSFGVDKKRKEVKCSNKYGAYTCAFYFSEYLKKSGIIIGGGYADVDPYGYIRKDLTIKAEDRTAAAQEGLSVLGTTLSPPLSKISYIVNQRSDNFYAEALFRILGKFRSGSAEYGKCRSALPEAFKTLGIYESYGYQIVDGSGLSKKNYVSPAFFCSFLKNMMGSKSFEIFLHTLTNPGKGSQAGRLKNESDALRNRIFWKSGSMDGVRCYSGYILPENGKKEDTIIFSFMLNSCTSPSWKFMPAVDRIIAAVAKEN